MASIFSLDKQVAKLPKHGFPMSQVFDFTSSTGHILPVYYDILIPGEKIRYSCDLFTRTQPLSSPANVDIDEFIDVFFVPLKKISSVADNILFQIQDVGSSNFLDNNAQVYLSTNYVLPLLDLSKIGNDNSTNAYLGAFNSGLTIFGSYAVWFDNFYPGAMRLFDHLNVLPDVLLATNSAAPMISPLMFACYQAIYMDYFRLSTWEANQVTSYNLDKGYGTLDLLSSGNPWALSGVLRDLLQLRYRPRQKDYFTNVFPSPLISQTGMLDVGISHLQSVNQWLASRSYTPITASGTPSVLGTGLTETTDYPSSYGAASNRLALSTASLRTMFAVDKLLKVTARAGKHYDDQVLAHFGFKVPQGYSDEVVHLGTHHQNIHIGEVISTASTSTGEIGELAGKGYGKNGSQVVKSFTAPCHGVFMAVYSCAPKISYTGGIDRIHTMVSRFDWFIPELDNLGMQPLFEYEIADKPQSVVYIAWQLRYMQEKCKYNRATRAFMTRLAGNTVNNDGPFADWVITNAFPRV